MRAVLLDSDPLSMVAHPVATPRSEACRAWARRLLDAGITLVIPEIVDYEVRRELLRMGRSASVRRLDAIRSLQGFTFDPVTSDILLLAADLWGTARRSGRPTADPHALDIDVILSAHARIAEKRYTEVIGATSNVGHLARFVPAALWHDIAP